MNLSVNWKDLGAAYSLSNLFFIISWRELVYPGLHHYRRPVQPSVFEYLAVFVDVLLLTAILLLLIGLTKSSRNWLARTSQFLLVVLGVLAFGPLSEEVVKWLSPQTVRLVNFYLPAAVLGLCLLTAARDRFDLRSIARNLQLVSLLLLPFSLLIVFESCRYQLFNDSSVFLSKATQSRYSPNRRVQPTRKVVWIVFDELDFALLDAAEHNSTDISEIRRLADQSFVARNAYAPNNRTQESIPALLTGVPIREAFTTAPNGLLLAPPEDSEPFFLGQKEDIFSDLRKRGLTSGIVGWYHPYCRIFQDGVSRCFWSALASPNCSGLSPFASCGKRAFLRAIQGVPFSTRIISTLPDLNFELLGESPELQEERNEYLYGRAESMLSDPNVDLLFFHSSVPHWPLIGRPDKNGDVTYYSALEVVNDVIGKVRKTLESTGQWENTVLVVSSDHFYRFKNGREFELLSEEQKEAAVKDSRIPFMVKLAGQRSRMDYEPTINTIITKRLILDIFDEKLTASDELVSWLDGLRNSQPSLINRKSSGRVF